jgi:hypothetical protein
MQQKECLLWALSPTLPRKRGRERTARAARNAYDHEHHHNDKVA